MLRVLLLLFTTICLSHAYAQDKLLFAIDLIRHGDRTPITEIPADPHHWDLGLGELTPKGMQQEFQLGRLKRHEYIDRYHLLPKEYQAETIYIQSTDYNRTLASAESYLLGLYPLKTGPKLNQNTYALPAGFQPVAIHTQPTSKDALLLGIDAHRKEYVSLLKNKLFKEPLWQEQWANNQENLRRWRELSGLPLTDFTSIIGLNDTLYIRKRYGIALPKGFTERDEKEIQTLANWAFLTLFKNKSVYSLMSEKLLSKVKQQLTEAIEHPSSLKYILYSAHDITLLALLNALQIKTDHVPPYASQLSFLLFEKENKQHYVQIKYNQTLLSLPGCQQHCEWLRFKQLINPNKR